MKKELLWSLISLALLTGVAQASTPDRVVTMTYNAQGLVDSVDGSRTDVSDVTHYTYDSQGRVATVTDALGHMTTFDTYDLYGHPGRTVDANQVISTMTYTPEGWLATVTRDSGGAAATTTVTYDDVGNAIKTQDADGVVTNFAYDAARRLTDVTDGAGNRIHYTLDAADNRLKEETFDAIGSLTRSLSRTVNSLSQLLTVSDALNRTVLSYNYPDGHDTLGHPTHSSDAAGIERKRGYDALNRLVTTIDNYNGTDPATQNAQSVSTYDASDNLEGISDQGGLNTAYDRDGHGNLIQLSSPDTGTSTYSYDAAGNRIQQTDAKGIASTYTYDGLNRMASVSYPTANLNVSYHYDEPDSVSGCTGSFPIGRLTRIVESTVTTTYCYDVVGNTVMKRQTQGAQADITRYSYTLAGRLAAITSPSLTVTRYSRDALGQISGIVVGPGGTTGQNVASNIGYLPFGPVTRYTLGNGQTVVRSYDANYALTDVTSPALNLHYARDVMGNVTALGDAFGAVPATETYHYDPLYRLSEVDDAVGHAIEAYTYNKTGDRLSKTSSGGLATGAYSYQSATHWLTSVGNASRSFDLNGNMTASALSGETLGFGYNDRNRLIVVQRNQQTVATYGYNAFGERVSKIAALPQAIDERFVYNEGSELIGEYGTSNRDYIWLDQIPVALVDISEAGNQVTYVHADGLGTPRAVSDATGTTLWQWPYQNNAFGDQPPTSSTGYVLNLRFPGQYYDVESGLSYNVNRYYESVTGRYGQSDPTGLVGGFNTYAYVRNRPLNAKDARGLQAEEDLDESLEEARRVQQLLRPDIGQNQVAPSPFEAEIKDELAGAECKAPGAPRLPRDINVNPIAPAVLEITRPISLSPTQNARVQADITEAKNNGGVDFRLNQQQVDVSGYRVGINRPDLQYTDKNGNRVYNEYDKDTSSRGAGHEIRIRANDPSGQINLIRQN